MKVAVIVSLWLLLTGGVGAAVTAAGRAQRPAGPLLFHFLFYFGVNALTALAVWAEFGDDAPAAGASRRRRARCHHDRSSLD